MNKKKQYLFIIILLFRFFLVDNIKAQNVNDSIDSNLKFGKYLIDKSLQNEAIFYFKALLIKENQDRLLLDSINNFLGRLHSTQQLLKESSYYYKSISDKSPFFNEALFQTGFNHSFLGQYDFALEIYDRFKLSGSPLDELYHFEVAGLKLLKRDFDGFINHASYFKEDSYELKQQEINLRKYKTDLEEHQYKSSLLAGTLSAILPGAGRAYLGKYGQGIMSLMICSIVGLQAAEGYKKDGPNSIRFISYSTAFTSLYIANIWGSAAAAQHVNNEFNEAVNHSILFDMHIPLRTIFR